MVLEFKKVWPNAKISVRRFGVLESGFKQEYAIDALVLGALTGDVDVNRLHKSDKKYRDGVNRERSSQDYVGGISAEEAIGDVTV